MKPDVFRPPPTNQVLVLVFVTAHEKGHWRVNHIAHEVVNHFEDLDRGVLPTIRLWTQLTRNTTASTTSGKFGNEFWKRKFVFTILFYE